MADEWFIGTLAVWRYGDGVVVAEEPAEAAIGSDVKVAMTLDEAVALGKVAAVIAKREQP